MQGGLGIAVAACVVIALGGPASAAAADVVCAPDSPPRAKLLYFHPGGFADGRARDPGNVELCHEFADRGYRTRVVDYPLFDVPGAVRAARRAAAREPHPRYALGDSSGGTLAALLAARGEVDAAATFAAPMDLLTWPDEESAWRRIHASRRDRIAASPYRQLTRREAPVLVMHDTRDVVVSVDQALRFVRRARRARFRRVRGVVMGHTWGVHHRRYIARWLDARR